MRMPKTRGIVPALLLNSSSSGRLIYVFSTDFNPCPAERFSSVHIIIDIVKTTKKKANTKSYPEPR